jgi:multicomponent Na+:H+ antiporter subunit E
MGLTKDMGIIILLSFPKSRSKASAARTHHAQGRAFRKGPVLSFVLTALIMLAFWVILSGEFTPVILVSAVVSSVLVAYWSHDLLFGDARMRTVFAQLYRFIKYLPWLFYQIALSNIDLVKRTLHPGMPIDPCVIEFPTDLDSDMGITILANSITLTPGTITINADGQGRFIVHAIAREPAEGLLAGDMQARVKRIEVG